MELPQVDLDQLRDLMKLMDQYDFDEIDVRDEKRRLHLLRNAVEWGLQAGRVSAP